MSTFRDYRLAHVGREKAASYDAEFLDPRRAKGLMWQLEQRLLGRVLDELPEPPLDAIDFACGTGRVLGFLATRVPRCTGVDVSPDMLAIAASRCPDARLLLGDVTVDPALTLDEFDLATSFRFLLNAQPPLRHGVLDWLHQRLRPGGTLVVNVHRNATSVAGVAAAVRRRARRRATPRALSVAQVRRLVELHGFDVTAVHGYGHLLYPKGVVPVPPLAARVEASLAGTGALATLASHVLLVARRLPTATESDG